MRKGRQSCVTDTERVSRRTVAPYLFFDNVTAIEKGEEMSFLPDGNSPAHMLL